MNETKSKIKDWIGDDDSMLNVMPNRMAEKLLTWLEAEQINIETDMDKVAEKVKLIEFEAENGSVEYEGETYILTEQAYITSRLLDDWHRDHNYFEMQASCIREKDCAGCQVYWMFKELPLNADGIEPELDEYDYDDVDHVEIYE